MIAAKVKKSFQVIIQHDNQDYDCCINKRHVHHATLDIISSDIENSPRIREISESLKNTDNYIEGNELTLPDILEKFYYFCQDYLRVSEVSLRINEDYELVLQYKK